MTCRSKPEEPGHLRCASRPLDSKGMPARLQGVAASAKRASRRSASCRRNRLPFTDGLTPLAVAPLPDRERTRYNRRVLIRSGAGVALASVREESTRKLRAPGLHGHPRRRDSPRATRRRRDPFSLCAFARAAERIRPCRGPHQHSRLRLRLCRLEPGARRPRRSQRGVQGEPAGPGSRRAIRRPGPGETRWKDADRLRGRGFRAEERGRKAGRHHAGHDHGDPARRVATAAPGGPAGRSSAAAPLYPRAGFLIQIGVPTNPNASWIWFSKKRWYEKCSFTARSVNRMKVGGATLAWFM